MESKYGFSPWCLAPVCIFFAFCLCTPPHVQSLYAQDGELTVIGNKTGVPASLSPGELTAVFKGERQRWPDNSKVIIVMMKSSTEIGAAVAQKVCNMSPDDLNKYWLAQIFRGKVTPPRYLGTEKELIDFVNDTPGAIGVISNGDADSSVRKIVIEEKPSH